MMNIHPHSFKPVEKLLFVNEKIWIMETIMGFSEVKDAWRDDTSTSNGLRVLRLCSTEPYSLCAQVL